MYTKENPYRIFSSGGGVQSVAVAVLQVTGAIKPYDAHIFANVGERAENPETLAYVRDHLKPYLEAHSVIFVEVRKRDRRGQAIDLYDAVARSDRRSVIIPAYLGQGGSTNRNCTTDWKIKQVDQNVRRAGHAAAVVGLGISLDEWQRARGTQWHNETLSKNGKATAIGYWKRREYPLIDLTLSRDACIKLIVAAGLPIPPKSSCFFCPFKRKNEWIRLRAEQPELFRRAVALEDAINAKGIHFDKRYYLSQFKRPLMEIPDQASMFGADDLSCDSGYCHT